MKKLSIGFAVCILVAGCANGPTSQQLAAADYGPMPTNHQAMIKEYVTARLRDPESGATFDFYKPLSKAWYGFGGVGQFGWATCATINAKNGYGGLTGPKLSYFLIRDGLIVQAIHSETDGADKVSELCATI